MTDLVSLVRYTVGADHAFIPHAHLVHERFAGWLAQQGQAGVTFTETEGCELDRMQSVIASPLHQPSRPRRRTLYRRRHRGALRDLVDRAADLKSGGPV